MIIIQLAGGLGNQLFQFAFGRALSLSYQKDLKFDLRLINRYQQHSGYSLTCFNYKPIIASPAELRRFPMWTCALTERTKKIINPIFNIFTEQQLSYSDENLRNIFMCSSVLYRGFWQSERYFKSFEREVREDLYFSNSEKLVSGSKVISDILEGDSVSVHLRRGDYISNPSAALIYNQCTMNYYVSAMEYISRRVENPVFYVFSDDVDYAKKLFFSYDANIKYVDGHSSPHEDIYAMSCCKHNIIANSTFSWWGAWLNKNESKIVISPRNWFCEKDFNNDIISKDFVLFDC